SGISQLDTCQALFETFGGEMMDRITVRLTFGYRRINRYVSDRTVASLSFRSTGRSRSGPRTSSTPPVDNQADHDDSEDVGSPQVHHECFPVSSEQKACDGDYRDP